MTEALLLGNFQPPFLFSNQERICSSYYLYFLSIFFDLTLILHWDNTHSTSDYPLALAGILGPLLKAGLEEWPNMLETLFPPSYVHFYACMVKQYQDSPAFH